MVISRLGPAQAQDLCGLLRAPSVPQWGITRKPHRARQAHCEPGCDGPGAVILTSTVRSPNLCSHSSQVAMLAAP